MTEAATLAQPRVRARTRQLDAGQGPSPQEVLRAKALEWIAANTAANAAKSAADKLFKEAVQMHAAGGIPTFDVVVDGKTYDIGELVLPESYVDWEALKANAEIDTILKEAKFSQDAVKNIGGQALLNKCLKTRDKAAEFKIKARGSR